MNAPCELLTVGERALEIGSGGRLLFRYVFRPETPGDESPRPYLHPVLTLAGAELTNFRPNDHRWHHALSYTLTRVEGVNFWGGGSYRREDGYQWRADHGEQRHVAWSECTGARLAHTLEWRELAGGTVLLREERELVPVRFDDRAWSLRWRAVVSNVSGRSLALGNYHSSGGLAGSHYTGLQFRGSRDLLDEHGDPEVRLHAEGGLDGEKAVHGAAGTWMEWRGQKDTTLQRVAVRFENLTGPVHWFVRRHHPLAALPPQYDRDFVLPPGGALDVDHLLTFSDL
jgi:hypothetical protein